MNRDVYEDSIILIGPSGAGKSTVGEKLAKCLNMKRVCLDGIANNARKNGIRARISEKAISEGNDPRDEFNLAMIHTLIEMAKEYNHPGITDFGAGHAVFNTQDGLKRAKTLLKDFKNIVLLLPCRDKNQALQIMRNRSTGDTRDNANFLDNPSYQHLATMTIYTDEKSPQEIADMILKEITKRKKKEQNMGEME